MYQVCLFFPSVLLGTFTSFNKVESAICPNTRVDDLSLQWRLKKKAEILAGNSANSRHRRSDRQQLLTLLFTTIMGACISIAMSSPSPSSFASTASVLFGMIPTERLS